MTQGKWGPSSDMVLVGISPRRVYHFMDQVLGQILQRVHRRQALPYRTTNAVNVGVIKLVLVLLNGFLSAFGRDVLVAL